MKDYKGALSAYDKAIDLNPYEPTYHYNRNSALDKLKRYDEALKEFDVTIDINFSIYDSSHIHNSSYYHYSKGSTLYKMEKYDEALKEFNESITRDPKNPEYHDRKGDTLYKTKK